MAEALAERERERERERESTGRERLISATHGRRRRPPARLVPGHSYNDLPDDRTTTTDARAPARARPVVMHGTHGR